MVRLTLGLTLSSLLACISGGCNAALPSDQNAELGPTDPPANGATTASGVPPLQPTSTSDADAPTTTQGDGGALSAQPGQAGTLGLPASAKSKQMPCDVADIVTKYCGDCHAGSHLHGPSLASAADFRAKASDGRSLYEVAQQKLNATDPHQTMPPAGYARPNAKELTSINSWLERQAPDTEVSCANPLQPAAEAEANTEGLTCYPLLAHNGDNQTPYRVGVAHDAYVNFTFAPPWKTPEYGVLIRPKVEHANNLHHALLYEEVKPGTPGGPTPSSQVHPDSLLIAAWLPGNPDMDLRAFKDDDVGLELRTDTTYTVELHYNSEDPNLSDRSGIEVCARKQKPKNVASYSWVGMDNFLFASEKWVSTCKPSAQEPIRLLSVLPHMHLKGIHFRATLNRLDGSKLVFHDQPFDFRFERQYPVNLTLYPGESITTECTYSEPKAYGPNVQDEMCTLFTMHYPKGTLVDDGLWSTLHGGGACLGGS